MKKTAQWAVFRRRGGDCRPTTPPHHTNTERLYMTTIEDFTSQYGLVQKIDAFGYMKYLAENPDAPRKHGKVVLVTADTPLKASRGEGKTTTTIALIDALNKRGIDATAVLRQPSMGITAAGSRC